MQIDRTASLFSSWDNSGSGKSTLIKLLLKELEPTSGTDYRQRYESGKDAEAHTIPKYRRRLGMVFQDFRLLKDRNVYENIAFAQRVIETPTRGHPQTGAGNAIPGRPCGEI